MVLENVWVLNNSILSFINWAELLEVMQGIRGQITWEELGGLCCLSFLQIQLLYFHWGSKMEKEREKQWLFQCRVTNLEMTLNLQIEHQKLSALQYLHPLFSPISDYLEILLHVFLSGSCNLPCANYFCHTTKEYMISQRQRLMKPSWKTSVNVHWKS